MDEIEHLMITVSLRSEARKVSRELQRLQNNFPSNRSVLKRYKMFYTDYRFRVRSLHAMKSHISAFWTITLCSTLGAHTRMCNSEEYCA
jgi:hypothetical protein